MLTIKPPTGVNAFAYMTLGRMIHFFLPSRSLLHVPASTIAAVFVALDVVSFAVQLTGGSMASPTSSAEDQLKSIHIYMGGIGMQEAFIVVFVCLAVKFQREAAAAAAATLPGQRGAAVGPARLLWALYSSLGLITIRIVYRLVEFSSGSVDNELTARESYFYGLEAAPMVFAIAVFNVVHPGAVVRGPGSEMPGLWATLKGTWTMRKGHPPKRDILLEDEVEGKARVGRYEMM